MVRDKNKKDIAAMLLKDCYNECEMYMKLLNQETVEKDILPKVDPNSTRHPLIDNIQDNPFINESVIMDLVKDGQVTKQQIDYYFQIKAKYRQYITMRITFHDAAYMYDPLKEELSELIGLALQKSA